MRRHAQAPSGTTSIGFLGPWSRRRTSSLSSARPVGSPAVSRHRAIASLGLVLLACLLLAAPASAAQTHPRLFSFDGSASPAGAFGGPERMAVDQSADLLYVLDRTSGQILKYDLSGSNPTPAAFSALGSPAINGTGGGDPLGDADQTPQDNLGFSADTDIAVDNSGIPATDGNLYVASEDGHLYAFDSSGSFLYELGDDDVATATTPGMQNPCGVAVDDDGSIYVSAYFASSVRKFAPAGASATLESEIPLGQSACHIAVDSNENLYASFFFSVGKFDASGVSQGTFSDGSATAIAVDPSDDHVYVDGEGQISEFDPSGAPVSVFGSGQVFSSTGFAIQDSASRTFVANPASQAIVVYGPLAAIPDVTIGAVTQVDDTAVTLTGAVNPSGAPVTDCHFEYVATEATNPTLVDSFDFSAPCDTVDGGAISDPGEIPADSSSHVVSADLSGLDPHTRYVARLFASSAAGTVAAENSDGGAVGGRIAFTTTDAPVTAGLPASPVTESTAVIGGTVDPNGKPTTFYIEYSPNADFSGSVSFPSTQDASAGSGNEPIPVSHLASGLDPASDYHFRIVTSNASGNSTSDPVSFKTLAPAPPQTSCPNDSFRTGHSAGLPDCRAFERITPADKNNGEASPGTVIDEDHVGFLSTNSFLPDDPYFYDTGRYLARRTAVGWKIRTAYGGIGSNIVDVNATDTQDVIAQVQCIFCPSLAPEDTDTGPDLYIRNATGTQLISTGSSGGNGPMGSSYYAGSSKDGSHVLFESVESLEPADSGRTEGSQLYDHTAAQTTVIGILPDARCTELTLPPGCVDPGGAVLGNGLNTIGNFKAGTAAGSSRAISEDGSTIFFESPDPRFGSGFSQLYARLDGAETVHVSASQCDPGCAGPAEPAIFQGAARNGSRVYFSTASRLLNEDTDPAVDLYQYNVGTGLLTLVTDKCEIPGGQEAECGWFGDDNERGLQGITAISDDGRRVYFGSAPENGIYLYEEDGDSPRYVTSAEGVVGSELIDHGSSAPATAAHATPDGSVLLFESTLRLTAFDNSSSCDGGDAPCYELYRYTADNGELQCVSCRLDGSPHNGRGAKNGANNWLSEQSLSPVAGSRHRNLLMSSSGSTVVFQTDDSLLPADRNKTNDIYMWEEGRLSMLTTGLGFISTSGGTLSNASIAGITPNGSDIFFTTYDQLVPSDDDNHSDLYDARIGGGLSADHPPPPIFPCGGDGCRDTGTTSSGEASPGSNTFSGPGNGQNAKPRCARGKVRRSGKCMKRKAKTKRARGRHSQQAHNGRGGVK